MEVSVWRSKREKGQLAFSKCQKQLGNSGRKIQFLWVFCGLHFQLFNPNRWNCVNIETIGEAENVRFQVVCLKTFWLGAPGSSCLAFRYSSDLDFLGWTPSGEPSNVVDV